MTREIRHNRYTDRLTAEVNSYRRQQEILNAARYEAQKKLKRQMKRGAILGGACLVVALVVGVWAAFNIW